MTTITDIGRALEDLEDAVTEHRQATERQQSAAQLLEQAHDDAVAAEDTRDETLQELLSLCGALLLQHANTRDRHTRFVVYATLPLGNCDLVLDTGDEAKAHAECDRIQSLLPASDPCIMRREYVQLESTMIRVTGARSACQAPQDRATPDTTDAGEDA